MLKSTRSYNAMVVAPHHLASQAGLRVLQEGGNAVEAMISAASTIAVAYPHMNGLGGDNFWLVHSAGKPVSAIDACGGAAAIANRDFYKQQQCSAIPSRGPLAALTMAGAVSGWQQAYQHSNKVLGGKLPLSRLLEDAIYYAREGVAVTDTLAINAAGKLDQLKDQPGFAERYMPDGKVILEGACLKQQNLANTLDALARNGLDDFYNGELASSMAADLESVGSPLRLDDFNRHQALTPEPLSLNVAGHKIYNMPPPTQGLASLLLLGVYERLGITKGETTEYVHAIVEATKCAFRIRDRYVTDPAYMQKDASSFLNDGIIDELAQQVDMKKAAPWPEPSQQGDTVWLGAMDKYGNTVSFIQSVFWEFGSGVILPESGITWQNRGTSFSLDESHHNTLEPFRRPFHTIQPALAELSDGRVLSYGTMGGEGQPQTQAMVFSRIAMNNMPVQQAITAPRWLLGKTWGSEATNLRIENRFEPALYDQMKAMGHDVEVVGAYEEFMGHAGALLRHGDGLIEAGSDPRSDGSAVGF
ncbi:MAG: gamma-glutamyltransferase family protein [Granulosicoccus sp.]